MKDWRSDLELENFTCKPQVKNRHYINFQNSAKWAWVAEPTFRPNELKVNDTPIEFFMTRANIKDDCFPELVTIDANGEEVPVKKTRYNGRVGDGSGSGASGTEIRTITTIAARSRTYG